MTLEEALENAAAGSAVLFLGSGFSINAENSKEEKFKTGNGLAKYLSNRIDLPSDTPLGDASEIFAKRFGVDELISELRCEFKVKNVHTSHGIVAKLPWKRIYTTNYDNVFETAALSCNKIIAPVGPDTRVEITSKSDPLCVHLNGYIDELNRETIWTSFKLTDTSYATSSIETSEWAALFRQDIRFAKSVFFIGYSLFDLDIRRILRASNDIQNKTFFILDDQVDAVTEYRGTRYGQVSKIGLEGLSKKIEDGGFLIPREKTEMELGGSVLERFSPRDVRPPTDRQFLDLVMLGDYNQNLSQLEVGVTNPYCCDRQCIEAAAEEIDSGRVRIAALHCDIANGRSIALEKLLLKLESRGWRTFVATELSERSAEEIRSIAELPGKNVLLVDDYLDWLRYMEGLGSVASDRFAMVVTARTNGHDLAADDLDDIASPLRRQDWNLNTLSESELNWWADAIDTYGLWGDRAGLSRDQKVKVLGGKCNRQINGILLELFESPQIKERLKEAALDIKSHPLTEKIAITIFALTILNQRVTVDVVSDVWGVDAFERESVQKNTGLRNFVDLNRSSVRVRSTAASKYLLNNFWKADEVVSVLIELSKTANNLSRLSDRYRTLFTTLKRFSSIQQVLPDQGKRDAVITYYENIKLIDNCKRDPLFWLQYAIGTLVIEDLQRADRYFDTAYSLADKRDSFDTYQIDNHYARFLLVRATTDAPFPEAVKLFRRARTLVNRQIKDVVRHYPYRVAASYQNFFDRFRSEFSREEMNEMYQAAVTVKDQIQILTNDRRRNRYVRQCDKAMDYIIETIANIHNVQ